MTAYVISAIEQVDSSLIQAYRDLAAPAVKAHGGRYAARGGKIETVEGSWQPNSLVILEFPSLETARTWYASSEYAEALAISRRALKRQLIFVEGL
jgi:uncharacterized protein (DUF1330 family)